MSPRSSFVTFVLAATFSIASSDYSSSGSTSAPVMISGEVGAGNYSYFKMHNESPGKLVLKSISGDADLYVSDVFEQPSFDFGEHNSSSTSCGDDEVDIPREVRRPVFIAVYGHPRYEISKFTLHVEPMQEVVDHFDNFFDADEYGEEEKKKQGKQKYPDRSGGQSQYDENSAPENKFWSFLWDVVYSILHCLVEILL